ncbi:hypothetical protein D3C75_830130 [compost metagenome]
MHIKYILNIYLLDSIAIFVFCNGYEYHMRSSSLFLLFCISAFNLTMCYNFHKITFLIIF